jgi:predicted DNA-binding ribbon-helix-helix protein
MCEIFISASPESYESRTRSVRLHGVVTSIRLENLFWDVLDEIAQRDDLNVIQLIEKLYDELITTRGSVGNFASFLRVSALRYQALLARAAIPADPQVPLRTVNAREALAVLQRHWALRPPAPPAVGVPQPQAAPSSSARSWAAVKSSAPL